MKFKICISALIMFLASCGKTHECPKESLAPTYISYNDVEIDTIILRRFTVGSNFTQKVDSTILAPGNCVFSKRSDTVSLFAIDTKNRLNDGYDWQIFNPTDQKTISISDMKFEIKETRSGGLFRMDPAACFSPIISYKRGNTVVPRNGSNFLFIHK